LVNVPEKLEIIVNLKISSRFKPQINHLSLISQLRLFFR
jgi:hypothetical protein